ncbi:iron chelate uptake ABC transporter family permease subunit [Streptomyces clavuligerus]|uniref:Putative iron ABC transporter permease protein n=1 Tax=Streptomyces clavuligerus TaxID=1901 RepID=B5GTZ5_STRCL|nr:iron chelate uptake ABC transporter family permease subunit [Streptomyces clavuligerus]ANW21386.1 enterobactin ABC transporter permease [Streptomyces clavuligerus]AXU16018.1 enterobactin ABC transporter permease [Streptomyces clavuligerus]EDY49791.1 ABC-type cobalamin/Fe3+-siderophore transport system [Streptomyces clavuligerus]EFG05468.1 putative iron ABC transporter permease protein [Streptomyces clavuligerus]MBY6306153.1 iron chelate uptake ABC transporter family permease subunit [Strept
MSEIPVQTPAPAKAPVRRALPAAARLTAATVLAAVCAACFLFLFVEGSFAFAFERRLSMFGTMLIVAFAQAVGTVVFQTITHNRILTPSIMGFDSVYILMQTLLVSVFGGSVLVATDGMPKLVTQTLLMVGFTMLLFGWLFSGRGGSLHVLLLVGVVLGLAFRSLSDFLQRLLSPAEYDVLSTRLYGRLSSAEAEYLPLAGAVCLITGAIVWQRRHRLDALLLGRDTATNLGISYRRELSLLLLLLISLLIAMSTALAGPMTFFGFVTALLAHQLAGTHRHAVVLPLAFLIGLITLVGGQFVMEHVFYASGMLTVVIEFVGGTVFLVHLLRKGTL